jgi:hypothetical protein
MKTRLPSKLGEALWRHLARKLIVCFSLMSVGSLLGSAQQQAPPAGSAPASAPAVDTSSASQVSLKSPPIRNAEGDPVPISKQQPKRILGVMPNYRAVSAGAIPPALYAKRSIHYCDREQLRLLVFYFRGHYLDVG